MAEWNCETNLLSKGGSSTHDRSNGVQKYSIRAEHISVYGSSVEIEIKFKNDWNKSTQTIWLKVGKKVAYLDPDGAAWQVVVNSISGDGLWAEVNVSICYYGGPEGDITNVNHEDKEKSGGLTGVGPDIRNIGDQKGTFDVKFYEGATHLRTASTGRMEAGAFIQNMVEMFTMPDRNFTVTVKLYLAGTSVLHDQKTVTVQLETITALSPVISSTSWSPKGTSYRIGAGAEFRGASGTRLKVVAVGPSTSYSLQVEEARIEIGTTSSKTYKRGETFVLDGKGYTILHVVSDWECGGITIGENKSTNQHPAIGEKINFAANVTWNDAGATAVSRKVEWFYLKPSSEHLTQAYTENINNWKHFAEGSMVEHTFNDAGDVDILYLKVIARNKANQTCEFGRAYCGVGQFNVWGGSDGFEITVVNAAGQDNLTIMSASLVPGTNAWMTGVIVMRWDRVTNRTYFGTKNDLGCAYSNPQPGLCGSMAMVVGQRYAIFRSTSFIAVVPGESVFELKSGRTAVTADRAYQNFLETTICGLFGITGSECNAFVAELFDPVFVANYISIVRTGKDTFGNERELTGFDHIALPFAVLGSLPGLNLLPFGALITKGLGALSKTGAKFGDEATRFMLNFSVPIVDDVISSRDTWYFLDAIGLVTEDHAAEIVNALTAGDTALADTLLRRYMGESKGWWDYHKINGLLKGALPPDVYNWMRKQSGLPEIGSGTLINTVKQTTLSADDLAKIADSSKYPAILDDAARAVHQSLKTLETSTPKRVAEIKNVLKNSPEISAKLVKYHKSMLDNVAAGHKYPDASEMRAILNHATIAPSDVAGMVMSADNMASIVHKLSDRTFTQATGNFLDSTKKYWNVIDANLGKTEVDTWVKNNAKIGMKAMDLPNADIAKMADIPYAAQKLAGTQGDLVSDYCGGHIEPCYSSTSDILFDSGKNVADELTDLADEFAITEANGWEEAGKAYAKNVDDSRWGWFSRLSDANKERAVHGMVGASLVFALVILVKLYTDAGPQSLNHNIFTQRMETAYWPCFHSCKDSRADDLANDIDAYEAIIAECAANLDKYKTVLEDDGTYNIFHRTLQLHQSNLAHFKSCLARLTPTGTIRCTSNIAGFHVWVDGSYKGHSYATHLKIIDAVKVGTHEVKIEKGPNYSPTHCTRSVSVTDGGIKTVDCQMTKIGDCDEVTSVNMYLDPLSPLKDETISFNGSAKSNDPLTSWKWDFDDGSPNKTGQAVTHTYSKARIYEVTLTVENDCGESETTSRNVTVSEEGVEESGTLRVEKPINAVHLVECTRAWEAAIHVDGNTIGKKTPFSIPFGTDIYIGGHGGPCGTHDITIILSGYDTLTKTFTIDDGDSKTWTPKMYPKGTTPSPSPMHDISFSVPAGASVYVDGKPLGSTSVGRLATILRGLIK